VDIVAQLRKDFICRIYKGIKYVFYEYMFQNTEGGIKTKKPMQNTLRWLFLLRGMFILTVYDICNGYVEAYFFEAKPVNIQLLRTICLHSSVKIPHTGLSNKRIFLNHKNKLLQKDSFQLLNNFKLSFIKGYMIKE
jgi:hypothetical protein